ncbi:ThuA domain-containing protein [Rubritalea tangerina]|uniref:ThuA domain-containing protein n=1 Tax=Rubritalea tangerina TaxID=430798 RepID=A0ABW4ZAK4_9BACT
MKSVTSRMKRWCGLGLPSAMCLSLLAYVSCSEAPKGGKGKEVEASVEDEVVDVLYVTHEPGRYHDYTFQRSVFTQLAEAKGWNLKVMSGTHDEVEQELASNKTFGEGVDVIVYNMCMAHCANPEVPYNIMQQTQKYEVPAVLVHCSLHSFWPTFKEKGEQAVHPGDAHSKVHTRKDLLAEWKKNHPGEPFPAWPNFTGLASTAHSPQGHVECSVIAKGHPTVKGLETFTTSKGEELYYNFINAEDSPASTSILKGSVDKGEAVVLWEHPYGKTKVVSFTLGHSSEEWNEEAFRKVLVNSVEYLAQ